MKMLSKYRALPSIHCPAVHVYMHERGDFGLGPLQPVGPVEGRELATLISIHDLGRTELVDGLIQRLEAEVGLKRVGDPPGQNFPGEPVHSSRHLLRKGLPGQGWPPDRGSPCAWAGR